MSAFELYRVVGSGSVQQLICQTIELPTPAEEIKEIRKTVIIDNCKVIYDKVIIDGRLRKDIMYKAADAGFPQPGNVGGCGGLLTTVAGPIEDVDVDIAFNALIPVKGACPDDHCVVLEAFVEGEKEEAANIQATGAFTALIDKSVVFLCVKVVRDTVIGMHHDDDHSGDDWSDSSDSSGHDWSGSDSSSDSSGSDHSGSDHSGSCKKSKHKKHKDKKHHDKKHKGMKHKEMKHKKKRHDKSCGHKDDCGKREHDLCPKRRSMGFFPGANWIPAPKPGPNPGTWVGPTLVFPGVLNPGIPTTTPLPNVIVNTQGTIVQVTHGQGGGRAH